MFCGNSNIIYECVCLRKITTITKTLAETLGMSHKTSKVYNQCNCNSDCRHYHDESKVAGPK